MFKLVGNMVWEYDRLVETATHIEISILAKEERLRSSRSRAQESQGDYWQNKKRRNTYQSQYHQPLSRSTFPLPSVGPGKSASSSFSCFKCGLPGHKAFLCPQKGGGQLILLPAN